jgi:hypothetical protein
MALVQTHIRHLVSQLAEDRIARLDMAHAQNSLS